MKSITYFQFQVKYIGTYYKVWPEVKNAGSVFSFLNKKLEAHEVAMLLAYSSILSLEPTKRFS
jgi:hypothetical protein